MGKLDLFSIVLQKQVPIYFGGETVVGTVNINSKERFKINGIKLIVYGGAQVRWYPLFNSGFFKNVGLVLKLNLIFTLIYF